MAATLDMTLDDMIKSSKRRRNNGGGSRNRGRGGGGSRGGRASGGVISRNRGGGTNGRSIPRRKGPLGVLNVRPSSFSIAKSFSRTSDIARKRDLFAESIRAAGVAGGEIGTKLYISNLDPGVTNDDIKELFAEIGVIIRYAVHYDRNGRSIGTAEVVYMKRSDAVAALKRYDSVQLDGKPMKIEIIGENSKLPVTARVNVTGASSGRGKRTVVMSGTLDRPATAPSRPGARLGRRGAGRSLGRGRGTWGKKEKPKSAEQLDMELESYHAGAPQT